MKKISVDILLPCFNEEKTIGESIKRIHQVMKKNKEYHYSIVVCDNNSTDHSRDIASKKDAIVIIEKEKGYGATLLNGIHSSKADYLVMLDADLSYNEKDIPRFLKELDDGNDLVMGNRFKGTIEKNAMPFSHRYGSRFLTEFANLLFHTPSHDYHCGLRAFKREEILKCDLSSHGFEFASEMIIKAKINHLKIKEISTDLFCDGRDKPPHLKTIKDGFRHLFLIIKVKYQTSPFVRYFSTYLLMMILFFFSLVLVALIPPQKIYSNTLKSLDYFQKYYDKNVSKDLKSSLLEGCGDVRNISLAYNMNPRKPFDSVIRMPYQASLDTLVNIKKEFVHSKVELVNYSRYWHGQAMYSKIMLLFMNLKYTYYVQLFVLIILVIILAIQLFRISKTLAISYLLMAIGINTFFTAFSVQYFFAIFLSYLFSIIIIRLYQKKSKNIGLMFAISGMLTCFFDFLTCETLVLSLPLFIYIFLNIKYKKKINYKEIINYILIWGFFYSLTYITKWFITCCYLGFDYIHVIIEKANFRMETLNMPLYMRFFKSFLLYLGDMLPFNYLDDGVIYIVLLLVFALFFLFFDYKKYLPLLLVTVIPLGRILLISKHSHLFHYYTYRAFGVVLLLIYFMFVLKLVDLVSMILLKKQKNKK